MVLYCWVGLGNLEIDQVPIGQIEVITFERFRTLPPWLVNSYRIFVSTMIYQSVIFTIPFLLLTWYTTRKNFNKIKTMDVTCGTGTAFSLGTPEFTRVCVAQSLVFCVVFCRPLFGHCIVGSPLNYGFWLPIRYPPKLFLNQNLIANTISGNLVHKLLISSEKRKALKCKFNQSCISWESQQG